MTCSSSDLYCRLDAIAAALNGGPSWTDVLTAVVTAAAAIASTIVAVAALKSSRQAVRIANSADEREGARDQERTRERVTSACADLLLAVANYRDDCERWLALPRLARANASVPSHGQVLAHLDVLMLVAPDEQQRILKRASTYGRQIRDQESIEVRKQSFAALTSEIRTWLLGGPVERVLRQIEDKPFFETAQTDA